MCDILSLLIMLSFYSMVNSNKVIQIQSVEYTLRQFSIIIAIIDLFLRGKNDQKLARSANHLSFFHCKLLPSPSFSIICGTMVDTIRTLYIVHTTYHKSLNANADE